MYSKATKGDEIPYPIQGIIKLLSHWVFQGIPRMDKYERTLKIGCTIGFTGIVYRRGINPIVAVILGHSLSFVLNSHVIAALKTLNISYFKSKDEFDEFVTDLLNNTAGYGWVSEIYVTGSVNREEWRPGSDLDLIVVRKPGMKNGVRGAVRAMLMRFTATLNLFPLDMYVLDKQGVKGREIAEELSPYNPNKWMSDK